MSEKKIMLSGIQPSTHLTLGNYLGAIKNWVRLQHDFQCYFFAANLHAITVRVDPQELREQTYRVLATYLAAGITLEHAVLFAQSQIPEHAELGWILSCFTSMGELQRMTQYKDKSTKQGQSTSAGLFFYPTLMAADILLYQTQLVPVGDDQKQHLEITRDLAMRFNAHYQAPLLTVPEGYHPPVGARIMSLQNPTAKMSKSDTNENGSVFLTDSNDQILKKLKRAVTDSGSEITAEPEQHGVHNLLTIQAALTGQSLAELVEFYRGKQYGALKIDTADRIITAIGPIREETARLLADRTHLDAILQQGAKQAKEKAHKTLEKIYDRIGFIRGKF